MLIESILAKSIIKDLVRLGYKARYTEDERREARKVVDAVLNAKTPEEYWKMRGKA